MARVGHPLLFLCLTLCACTSLRVPGDRPLENIPDWLPALQDPWARHPQDDLPDGSEDRAEVVGPPGDLGDPELLLDEADGDVAVITPPPIPGEDVPVSARVAWAWDAFFDGRLADAEEVFRQVSVKEPERADAAFGLGRCYLAEGEREQARQSLEWASELSPLWPDPLFYLGVLRYQEGDMRGAAAVFSDVERLLEGKPPGALEQDFAWITGRTWLALGDRSEGAAWMARAMAITEQGRFPRGPGVALERDIHGRLPAEEYAPLAERAPLDLGPGLVFVSRGQVWHVQGQEAIKFRLMETPPDARVLKVAVGPGGQLALVERQAGRAGQLGVVWVEGGERRKVAGLPAAPLPPVFEATGNLRVVGDSPAGSVLYRVHHADLALERLPLPEGITRVAEVVDLRGRLLMAAERQGGTRLLLVEGDGSISRPTMLPAQADPWRGTASEVKARTPLTLLTPEEAPTPPPPMSLADPWTPGSGARQVTSEVPGQKAAVTEGRGGWWDPTEGDRQGRALLPSTEPPPSGLPQPRAFSYSSHPPPALPPEVEAALQLESPGPPESRETGRRNQKEEIPGPLFPVEWEEIPGPLFPVEGEIPSPPTRVEGGAGGPDQAMGEDSAPLTRTEGGAGGSEVGGGLAPEVLEEVVEGDERSPTVAPDGSLAFTRVNQGRRRVWLISPGAGFQRVLTPPDRDCASPAFSPDGKKLVYVCQVGDTTRPFVLDLATGKETCLFLDDGRVSSVVWVVTPLPSPPPPDLDLSGLPEPASMP